MSASKSALDFLKTCGRLLTFRSSREELLKLDTKDLAFGMVCTWLVGMGRYWDDPGAKLSQKFGLGSVLYVFFMATFLWLVMWPLSPKDWRWRRVLTFVALVSPPAVLYALPIERWLSLDAARRVNVYFLAIVATWRVALLFFFFVRLGRLRWYAVTIGGLLPLSVIVSVLTLLNLERAVFNIMAGLGPDEGTANDMAYAILVSITAISVFMLPLLIIGYLVIVALARKRA